VFNLITSVLKPTAEVVFAGENITRLRRVHVAQRGIAHLPALSRFQR
jgi:ABC-type branched-subunit amino acid transport system ATPase component